MSHRAHDAEAPRAPEDHATTRHTRKPRKTNRPGTGLRATLFCIATALALPTMAVQPPPNEVQADRAYVNRSNFADWLVPDYVVKFHVPRGVQWEVVPRTGRAETAFRHSGRAAHAIDRDTQTEITLVAGGRARRAAGYGRSDAWEYANELRVRYR
ncbi:MAG: hypothetical protein U1E83_07260 [Methylotetracoccus sp.]